jgi:hypothetical protein
MELKWQDGDITGKKLKKPSRTPEAAEEVSQAKKQYEQKRSRSFKLHWTTDRLWLRYDELLLFVVSSTVEQTVSHRFFLGFKTKNILEPIEYFHLLLVLKGYYF